MARIGVIGAGGWLGGAIVRRMLAAGLAGIEDPALSSRIGQPDKLAATCWTRDNRKPADR